MPEELPQDWEEEGKWSSAAQALVLILVFFTAVIFGANINFSRTPLQAAAAVSLIPAPSAPAPKPKPEIKPEEKKPKTKTPTKPEKKKPKRRRILHYKKKKALEKKRKEEARKKRKEEKKRKKEEARKKREEKEKQRKAREERERLARKKAEEEAARQNALNRIKDSYIGRIIGSIEPSLTTPKHLNHLEGLEVVVEVNLHSDGTLDGFPEVAVSSGYPEYDEAAVRAVLKASPLPLPPDPNLRKDFLNLKLHISPE